MFNFRKICTYTDIVLDFRLAGREAHNFVAVLVLLDEMKYSWRVETIHFRLGFAAENQDQLGFPLYTPCYLQSEKGIIHSILRVRLFKVSRLFISLYLTYIRVRPGSEIRGESEYPFSHRSSHW